jgi:hypothetical protein
MSIQDGIINSLSSLQTAISNINFPPFAFPIKWSYSLFEKFG